MHDIAEHVTEDLYLDVATTLDERLDEHGAVAECRRRLTACRLDRIDQVDRITHDAHSAPPPPAAALISAGIGASSGMFPFETSTIRVVGTPASMAARLAEILSPSRRI